MPVSTRRVHKAHIVESLPELHQCLIDIMGVMNQPERDVALLEMAGLTLERALMPLLVLIERLGPIGVVDLAGRIGRDYTTVSRQVARLEALGMVIRRAGPSDRRMREASITPRGKSATDALDTARETMALALFSDWSNEDFRELLRLMKMLAGGMNGMPT